jgi:dolichol-phosphate mannosyltransferase
LAAADPRVKVVHTPNGGHGPALMRAIDASRGEFVLLIDSDNQISLEHFGPMWTAVSAPGPRRIDAAFGIRRIRQDAQIRRVLTKIINGTLSALFGIWIRDANVPFKLVRRSVWVEARRYIPDGTLAPSLFLAAYMLRTKREIAYFDVVHKERETGTVSIRRWKLIKFCARAFRQLLTFRTTLRQA